MRNSQNHNAFTSKVTHLFVERNIQEALGDPNWKLVVMEEMNALRISGTWEIVDLPGGQKNYWMQMGIYGYARLMKV